MEYSAADSNAARPMPTAMAATPGAGPVEGHHRQLEALVLLAEQVPAGTSVSLKVTVAVFEARWPSLSSFLSITTVSSRGTTKAQMPRWPASRSVFA